MITSKDILDKTFDRAFRKGEYRRQLTSLDATGGVDTGKRWLVVLKLLEALDETQERFDALESKVNRAKSS